MTVSEVMGCTPEEYSDRLYHTRPAWAVGIISHLDARYLFNRTLGVSTDLAVEIGTASGVSTAFLCRALDVLFRAQAIERSFEVRSYDITDKFYADTSRQIGDATREMLPSDLLSHVTFRAPGTALTVADEFRPDSLGFMFLDANHRHPWPALDLLATLDCLQPGAEVVLHDINLPIVSDEWPVWGAKYVFDDLEVPKESNRGEPVPNIGSIWIPTDKTGMREQLLAIIAVHEWEIEVSRTVTSRLFPDASPGP